MHITRKEFDIVALTDDSREFIIEERLYVFNQCIWVNTVTLEDGLPFISYFAAKKTKEKLENKENSCNFVKREGKIILTIIFSILLLILWAIV